MEYNKGKYTKTRVHYKQNDIEKAQLIVCPEVEGNR